MSSEKLDTVIEHFTARANANSPPQKYARLATGALCSAHSKNARAVSLAAQGYSVRGMVRETNMGQPAE